MNRNIYAHAGAWFWFDSRGERYFFIFFKEERIMENMKHGEEYVCKRWRMLTWLMQRGYKPIRTIPDVKRTDYFNWVFQNTPEFEQDVEIYFAELKK